MSDQPLDAVIKVGGSLSRGAALPELCRTLSVIAARRRVLIVPGGGAFADAVRVAARRYPLGDDAAHWMAILGMDQYGYLLASLISDAHIIRDLADAPIIAATGATPVLLPFDALSRHDPLPHSWDVTSDSIAAWICRATGAARLVLLKDVDGLFSADPQHSPGAVLIPRVPLSEAARYGGVDPYLPLALRNSAADVWVINGTRPDRLLALLDPESSPITATRIIDLDT